MVLSRKSTIDIHQCIPRWMGITRISCANTVGGNWSGTKRFFSIPSVNQSISKNQKSTFSEILLPFEWDYVHRDRLRIARSPEDFVKKCRSVFFKMPENSRKFKLTIDQTFLDTNHSKAFWTTNKMTADAFESDNSCRRYSSEKREPTFFDYEETARPISPTVFVTYSPTILSHHEVLLSRWHSS